MGILFRLEKYSPLGKAEIFGYSFKILCLKIQIPSTKSQLNLKFQYSITKTFQHEMLFGFSNFGHWYLFDIWDLIFGISISQRTFNKANFL